MEGQVSLSHRMMQSSVQGPHPSAEGWTSPGDTEMELASLLFLAVL